MWQKGIKTIQEKVSLLFYSHGLFCASHPFAIISLVITIILITSYPLTTLPLPGNAPLQYRSATKDYQVPPTSPPDGKEPEYLDKRPRWYRGAPVAYVMQVIVKSTVSPWHPKRMIQTDAFRGPLSKVFEIVQQIENFQHKDRDEKKTAFSDICLHVFETRNLQNVVGLLPKYNCLAVSPANFWGLDKNKFDADGKLVGTITKAYGKPLDVPPSIRDLLFGVPWKDTGIRSFFLRNRQRVISYSVTLLFKEYKESYIEALRKHLELKYPSRLLANGSQVDHLVHIYFKDINYFVEYTPLLVAYIVLFLYLYFSVRKIEMVKSKWGLALSAVVTVVSSLLMSIGICTLFGLTPSLNGSEIFPYLVVIIGLENVLVVTKSVVSTEVHLDVKLRVAQGLQKEGWSIFKNLMTELLILAVGFFTFVPAIQEFCLFAVVGLLSDFFLQMFFFTTVLSIDIRRMELSDLHKQTIQHELQENKLDASSSSSNKAQKSVGLQGVNRPYVHDPYMQRVDSRLYISSKGPSQIMSVPSEGIRDDFFFPDPLAKTPRRVRLMNYWARTRFMQRAIMVCVVLWIALIVYKTGLVEHLAEVTLRKVGRHPSFNNEEVRTPPTPAIIKQAEGRSTASPKDQAVLTGVDVDVDLKYVNSLLTHQNGEQWRELSYNHWPTLLGYYNITMFGRYITLLPTLHLSLVVPSDQAVSMRHPDEKTAIGHMEVVPGTDPSEQDPDHVEGTPFTQANTFNNITPRHHAPFNITVVIQRFFRQPESRTELVMTILLGIASFILMTYFLTALYKCMCSRNYAKWRTGKHRRAKKHSPYYKQIRETVPLVLDSHLQEVECVVTDGPLIISSCLGGQICVWDSMSGECLTSIHRSREQSLGRRSSAVGQDENGSEQDFKLQELRKTQKHMRHKSLDVSQLNRYSSECDQWGEQTKPVTETYPDLAGTIETDFSALSAVLQAGKHSRGSYHDSIPSGIENISPTGQMGYDFGAFSEYFEDHDRGSGGDRESVNEAGVGRTRSLSQGDTPDVAPREGILFEQDDNEDLAPAVWCLACQDCLIVTGCGDGKIEFWDGLTGAQKYVHQDSQIGVTSICLVGNKLIAARLNGILDFLELETFGNPSKPTAPTKLHNRNVQGHRRTGSSGGQFGEHRLLEDVIRIKMIDSVRAHQRPINILQSEGGRVVTACQDHTLKVFRVEDSLRLYTLHGHNGGVTALFLDKTTPMAAASGAEDGTVRLWDLLTGSCVHKLHGHSTTVTTVTCTGLYVISVGADDLLCIWERCKGHLLHWIQMEPGYCNTVAMLTSNLMVTGGQGCLHLWDASKGEVLRAVAPGDADTSICVRYLCVINNSTIVCDYGSQLRVIHFPSVLEKAD